MGRKNGIKVFSGSANPGLAAEVVRYLNIRLGRINLSRFSDGEMFVRIGENVRGNDVYFIQPTCSPVNETLMELLITLDALKRASAGSITAVIPYFGYARQDRKKEPRTPITARLVADIITAAGANRVVTIDLHSGQTQGFFNIPEDNLYARPELLEYLKRLNRKKMVVVSPDAGGTDRARSFAGRLKCGLALIDKRREEANKVAEMNVIGDVEGMHALLVDDMVDTAGTLVEAAKALIAAGAATVDATAAHAVLSGPAIERLINSPIRQLIVTDTIPLSTLAQKCGKIKVVSVAQLLAQAIQRIHDQRSISGLF